MSLALKVSSPDDSLGFSDLMLDDGVQVNPMEWWDEHWIHDRIMSKL